MLVIYLSPFYGSSEMVYFSHIQKDNTMTNQEMLISYINKLTEDEISSLLEDGALILETKELTLKPPYPYCGSAM